MRLHLPMQWTGPTASVTEEERLAVLRNSVLGLIEDLGFVQTQSQFEWCCYLISSFSQTELEDTIVELDRELEILETT